MTEITFIYNLGVSVGLEYNFFRLKPFHISKICANIDMISGVYKKIFWGNSGHLRNHYLSILRGS